MPEVLYFSKKRPRSASGTAPALCTCACTMSAARSKLTVTALFGGAASIAFFTTLASIE